MRRWAKVRAALIALGIAIELLEGCPVPRVGPETLGTPVNQRELERWAGALGHVGVERTPAELAADVLRASEAIARSHAKLVAPFEPWFRVTQTRQEWSLFPVADPEPFWMLIEGRERDGEWRTLFRPIDPEHRFMAGPLEYRRVRGIWNPGTHGARAPYSRFADWLAREAFARDPRLVAIRVRMERLWISLPGEPPVERDPIFEMEQVRERGGP